MTKVTIVSVFTSDCRGTLPDTLVAAQFVPAQTFSVDELVDSLHSLCWCEESCRATICLCRQTPPKMSVDLGHLDLHRFHSGLYMKHHSLRLLREYHFISCLTMSIMNIFRRLFNTLLETGSDILQTPSTHEGLNFCQF